MKTTFGRLFALLAAVVFLCLLLMGIAFQSALYWHLQEEHKDTLHRNAEVLANYVSVFEDPEELRDRWGSFRISLISATQISGCDAVLCDAEGVILQCACEELDCIHEGHTVDKDLTARVMELGEDFFEGTLDGMYEDEQLVQAMALSSHATEEPLGVLFLTISQEEAGSLLVRVGEILVWVSVIVLLAALVAAYFMSRTQSRDLQAVVRAANRFGHGELETRVPVRKGQTGEMTELANAFNTMAESLAQSERQRMEFVANVSHELKTPMTTISGFTDGMLDGTIPQQEHRHYMQLISDEVRRLSRLVRNMLEISRLQSQKISEEKKRRFDLCESIGLVLISFEQKITRKGIHMDVRLPDRSVWVKAEPDSITQVLYNLTDNAVKFCNEGGALSISLTAQGSKARVTVCNTGPVVDPAELPLLFDRFHKADKSRSEDREGVGLGLYIVKTILDGHGEDIKVTSEQDLTTFSFALPVVR